MKFQTEPTPSVNRSPNPSVGWVPFSDMCQILQTATHDLTPDFLPEDEFGFSATDLCGKKAEGDMFIVNHPDDYVTRAIGTSSSDDFDGYIEADYLSAEIIEF